MRCKARRLLAPQPTAFAVTQAAGERQPRHAFQAGTVGCILLAHLRHALQHPASALRRDGGCRIRRTQQGGGQRGFLLVQTIRPLAEQAATHRRYPLHLAAKTGEVEVGLQNLVLLPALLQPQRTRRLRKFLRHVAAATPGRLSFLVFRDKIVEQADKLH